MLKAHKYEKILDYFDKNVFEIIFRKLPTFSKIYIICIDTEVSWLQNSYFWITMELGTLLNVILEKLTGKTNDALLHLNVTLVTHNSIA